MVDRLEAALYAVAERRIDGDPLPCFCVQYHEAAGSHDEWCEDARDALADANRLVALQA